jgi:hypothetical protein
MDAAFEKTYRLCCRGLCTAEAVPIIKTSVAEGSRTVASGFHIKSPQSAEAGHETARIGALGDFNRALRTVE